MKIFRVWRGFTSRENAGAYGELLEKEILPGIHRVKGYEGAHLLRREAAEEVEFVTITVWGSWDAIREFAGTHSEGAVVPPQARRLLARFDEEAQHYEATWVP